MADASGFKISAKQLLDALPRLKGKVNFAGAFDESAVNSVESRLKLLAVDENKISSIQKLLDAEKDPSVIARLQNQIQQIKKQITSSRSNL